MRCIVIRLLQTFCIVYPLQFQPNCIVILLTGQCRDVNQYIIVPMAYNNNLIERVLCRLCSKARNHNRSILEDTPVPWITKCLKQIRTPQQGVDIQHKNHNKKENHCFNGLTFSCVPSQKGLPCFRRFEWPHPHTNIVSFLSLTGSAINGRIVHSFARL